MLAQTLTLVGSAQPDLRYSVYMDCVFLRPIDILDYHHQELLTKINVSQQIERALVGPSQSSIHLRRLARHLIPKLALQTSARSFFADTPPLFEEERNSGQNTLIADPLRPRRIHRTGSWP